MRIRMMLLVAVLVTCVAVAASAVDNVMFILDASNSMNKDFGDDTRLNTAKQALIDLLGVVGNLDTAGLYVYGHRVDKDNEVESCQDIEALFPVLPADAESDPAVIDTILGVAAMGKTPIADALVAASNQLLGLEGESAIVLITDGEETCGGDPEVVAQTLATMEPPITLHIVGLEIGFDVQERLARIAGITGGNYYAVGAAEELFGALYTVVAPPETVEAIPSYFARFGVTNVIYGTEGDDVLYGTPENDLILGLGGNDFIIGLDGNDVLCGGAGDDILEGVGGNDWLDGGAGDDLIFGGPGDDIVCGGPGNDSLEGDAGDDVLDGNEGNDTLLGGYGNDMLYSADAADILLEGQVIAGTSAACPVCTQPCAPEPVCPQPPVEKECPPPAECATPVAPEPPPVATPVCEAPPVVKTLNEGESIQLHGTVSDSDCNIMQQLWQASVGTFDDAACLDPVYTAPMLDGCDNLDVEIVLTAVDTCGASASDAFILHIVNVNHPPTLELGDPLVVNEGECIAITPMVGDADGEPLSYAWGINGNWGRIEDSAAPIGMFYAPMIDACDGVDIMVTLSVTDPCGATVCDQVMIHVRNVNEAPSVDLGPDFALTEGTAIQMKPVIVDPECEMLTYCWTASAGSFDDSTIANPTYTVPFTELCNGEMVTLTLTVMDPCGLTATDSVNVQIVNVNCGPTVDLGPDLCVNECSSTLLTPVVSDPDGDQLTYTWTVSNGALDSYCGPAAIFTAPVISDCGYEDVIITLTVTDPCGLVATDTINVRVENVNQPPKVHADP